MKQLVSQSCHQNCRELTLIDCEWSVRHLKNYLGNQAKLYVRPIQNNLSIEPFKRSSESCSEVKCNHCSMNFSIRELRKHVGKCTMSKVNESCSESDELPDPGLTNACTSSSVSDTDNSISVKGAVIYVIPSSHDNDNSCPTDPYKNQDIINASSTVSAPKMKLVLLGALTVLDALMIS